MIGYHHPQIRSAIKGLISIQGVGIGWHWAGGPLIPWAPSLFPTKNRIFAHDHWKWSAKDETKRDLLIQNQNQCFAMFEGELNQKIKE